jgi:hypothetical protein
VTAARDVWEQAGWDAADADDRHVAVMIRERFSSAQRPTVEQLAWFRQGFALRRAGQQRPPHLLAAG